MSWMRGPLLKSHFWRQCGQDVVNIFLKAILICPISHEAKPAILNSRAVHTEMQQIHTFWANWLNNFKKMCHQVNSSAVNHKQRLCISINIFIINWGTIAEITIILFEHMTTCRFIKFKSLRNVFIILNLLYF